MAEELLKNATSYYLNSGDFNGLPVNSIATDSKALEKVVALIKSGHIDLVRGDGHPNPHIKALEPDPIDLQLKKIIENGLEGCIYPTTKALKSMAGNRKISGRPYSRLLSLGSPQLDFRVFDLRFLEWYRNDPRYYYEVDDIHGQIRQREGTKDKKGAVLQDSIEFLDFGFAYDQELNRGIAVFLRYLHDLPPKQQQLLKASELKGDYRLHPDFYRTQIIGDFPTRVSIYDAFLEEKNVVNQMCKAWGRPNLFRTNNRAYERPTGFSILIRPTNKEFRDFCLQLDQLLSDDLDSVFFKDDIPIFETVKKDDESTFKKPIGTITLLENWLKQKFKTNDKSVLRDLFKDLRAVRLARQKPAHKAVDNDFDQKYLVEQRCLIVSALNAVRTIRMILENHPAASSIVVPEWLRSGKVWEI